MKYSVILIFHYKLSEWGWGEVQSESAILSLGGWNIEACDRFQDCTLVDWSYVFWVNTLGTNLPDKDAKSWWKMSTQNIICGYDDILFYRKWGQKAGIIEVDDWVQFSARNLKMGEIEFVVEIKSIINVQAVRFINISCMYYGKKMWLLIQNICKCAPCYPTFNCYPPRHCGCRKSVRSTCNVATEALYCPSHQININHCQKLVQWVYGIYFSTRHLPTDNQQMQVFISFVTTPNKTPLLKK